MSNSILVFTLFNSTLVYIVENLCRNEKNSSMPNLIGIVGIDGDASNTVRQNKYLVLLMTIMQMGLKYHEILLITQILEHGRYFWNRRYYRYCS
jgi:hypothetical protein